MKKIGIILGLMLSVSTSTAEKSEFEQKHCLGLLDQLVISTQALGASRERFEILSIPQIRSLPFYLQDLTDERSNLINESVVTVKESVIECILSN